MAAKSLAAAVDAHPADLVELNARLAAAVLPGDRLDLSAQLHDSQEMSFEVGVGDLTVLKAGHACYR